MISWLLGAFTSPVAAIAFIRALLPLIKELRETFKGQPTEIKIEAMGEAVKAAKKHCDGVGCPTGLK